MTRSNLLTPTDTEKEDPNIAAALAKASGETAAPASQSVADRLAALKKK
jgi:hypothetical protein